MIDVRRKAGDARRRQVNRLRKQAQMRTIVVEGKEFTAPVIECPPPMNCKPLGSQPKWPGTANGQSTKATLAHDFYRPLVATLAGVAQEEDPNPRKTMALSPLR